LYNEIPENGLVVFCGFKITKDGKERKVTFHFNPFKPIAKSLYYCCDNKFHTEDLIDLLFDEDVFGFIVIDGNGNTLFGIVKGSHRQVLRKISVNLPKKHGRWCQFDQQKRYNYVEKVTEIALQLFVSSGQVPCVEGIVLAGSEVSKTELIESDLFDPRLTKIIIQMVNLSYGGQIGFNYVIDLLANILGLTKVVKEKQLLQRYMDEISKDMGMFCFMVEDTIKALELGAVEDLIVWKSLDLNRILLRDVKTKEETVVYMSDEEQQSKENIFSHLEVDLELELIDVTPIVEWLAYHYKDYRCNLNFVSNGSRQFIEGFGGIGGILKRKIDYAELKNNEDTAKAHCDDSENGNDDIYSSSYDFDDDNFGF